MDNAEDFPGLDFFKTAVHRLNLARGKTLREDLDEYLLGHDFLFKVHLEAVQVLGGRIVWLQGRINLLENTNFLSVILWVEIFLFGNC